MDTGSATVENSVKLPPKTKKKKISNYHRTQQCPLLGIYADKMLIKKDTRTPMFIAALFTTAKTQKQSKCPSIAKWIKMQRIDTMQYCPALIKNGLMPFVATGMQLEIITW